MESRASWPKFCLGHESPEIFYFLFWKCRLQEGLVPAVRGGQGLVPAMRGGPGAGCARAGGLTVQCSYNALSACFPGSPRHAPCLCQWKLPEWTSRVHSTLSQLGHAKDRSSQRLTLLFPVPTLKVTLRSHRSSPL